MKSNLPVLATEDAPVSLIEKKEVVISVAMITPRKDAEKWFALGIKKHAEFERGMKQARRDWTDAAFAFLRCRSAFDHGDWQDFLRIKHAIPSRTVRFYIQLARHAQDWVLRSPDINPKPKNIDEVNAAARDLILYSPKPLIALLRELEGWVRPFGEYDSVKYATRKLSNGNTAQIEFKFDELLAPLDHLCHFGEDNYTFIYPAGVDESQFIDEAIAKGKAVVARLEAIKQHGRVIEA